jgi:pimeloyl-ACP methyl ester carboxylesterase
MPEAMTALQTNTQVEVEKNGWIEFTPKMGVPSTGFIIYPGGRVDPTSYAPIAQAISEQGYLVAIIPMPLNLAVFGINRASQVIAAHPEISHWAIGGHSLGGSMAASYAHDHPDLIDGLVLWASYPASSDDLSKFGLDVLSISGSQDGLVNQDKILEAASLLPEATHLLEIQGGNHAQFGWYGPQPGDGTAAISRQDQQEAVIRATDEFLAGLGK